MSLTLVVLASTLEAPRTVRFVRRTPTLCGCNMLSTSVLPAAAVHRSKKDREHDDKEKKKNAWRTLPIRLFGITAAFPLSEGKTNMSSAGGCIYVPYKSCGNTQHLVGRLLLSANGTVSVHVLFRKQFLHHYCPPICIFARKQSRTVVERFKGRVKGLRALEEGCGRAPSESLFPVVSFFKDPAPGSRFFN